MKQTALGHERFLTLFPPPLGTAFFILNNSGHINLHDDLLGLSGRGVSGFCCTGRVSVVSQPLFGPVPRQLCLSWCFAERKPHQLRNVSRIYVFQPETVLVRQLKMRICVGWTPGGVLVWPGSHRY